MLNLLKFKFKYFLHIYLCIICKKQKSRESEVEVRKLTYGLILTLTSKDCTKNTSFEKQKSKDE